MSMVVRIISKKTTHTYFGMRLKCKSNTLRKTLLYRKYAIYWLDE